MAKKILVVDDNEDLLDLIMEILSVNGYEAVCISFTQNITASVMSINPDLVIMDYLLAGVNGGELCAELKKNPLTCSLPVLIMSAYPRVLESLGHYGQDAFVAKPFELEILLVTIKNCLARSSDELLA